MKRFCAFVIICLLVAGSMLLALTLWNVSAIHRVSWKLSPTTHIIAIGPSTTGCALNEQHINGFQNLSKNGTHIALFVPILQKVLKENPQIDTVLINHGRFQFTVMTDKYVLRSELQKIRNQLSLLFLDTSWIQWWQLLSNPNFYGAVLNPDIFNLLPHSSNLDDIKDGYIEIDRNNLYNPKKKDSIACYDSIKDSHGGNIYTKEWILENCSTTDYCERKAIQICREHGVVPVLFFTPLYQYSRWCERDGFCEYMKSYDNNTLIADYEDFAFPDERYYGDVVHLNRLGADYFTSYLAKNGIKAQQLSDWLKSKGN